MTSCLRFSLVYTHKHTHLRSDRAICDNGPSESAHKLTDTLLKLWIFTVMLTVLLLSYSPMLVTHINAFVRLCHTHTQTQLSLPCRRPSVPSLRRFCSRHQNGHLSSISRPLCPLLPPADTYSPLQLCCSISHPTHAVMGCWLYLATVMVTLVQMRDFLQTDTWWFGVEHNEQRQIISADLLFWQMRQFVLWENNRCSVTCG